MSGHGVSERNLISLAAYSPDRRGVGFSFAVAHAPGEIEQQARFRKRKSGSIMDDKTTGLMVRRDTQRPQTQVIQAAAAEYPAYPAERESNAFDNVLAMLQR